MSQTEIPGSSVAKPPRDNWMEITPQALYDKLVDAVAKLVVELASGGGEPVPRSRPRALAAVGSQPGRTALGDDARAGRPAGLGDGALHAHQSGPPPVEGLSQEHAKHVGCARGRRAWARCRWRTSRPSSAFTSRCRFTPAASACCRAITSRAPAVWACRWWRLACSTTKATSSSTWMSTAGSRKSISTRKSRTWRWNLPATRTASRSRFRSTLSMANCTPRCG